MGFNKLNKKISIITLCLLLCLYGGYEALGEIQKLKQKKAIDQQLDIIVTRLDLTPTMNFHEVTDTVRHFVYNNSTHKIDEETRFLRKNPDLMLERISKSALSQDFPKPHLECSSRSSVVSKILKKLGYKTRAVNIRAPEKNLKGHSFIEVYNAEHDKWEIIDPDKNSYWIKKEYVLNSVHNKRASIEDLLSNDLNEFIPCRSSTECGVTKSIQNSLRKFTIASIVDKDNNFRPLLVNIQRFDFFKEYDHKGKLAKYCEHFEKNCRQEIKFYNNP